MSFLSRILGIAPDPREQLRPLWLRIVELARDKEYYANFGVSDSVEGRFDMITAVLAMVLLRMERNAELVPKSVWLTELFVEDMDGQLRQGGVGDVVVGKHMGKVMGTMGGRLGAYRTALAGDEVVMADAVARNVSMAAATEGAVDGPEHGTQEGDSQSVAVKLLALAARLGRTEGEALLNGDIAS